MGAAMPCCELSKSIPDEANVSPISPKEGRKRQAAKDKGKDAKGKDGETNPQEAPTEETGAKSSTAKADDSEDVSVPFAVKDDKEEANETPRRASARKSFKQLARVESKEERDFTAQSKIASKLISYLDAGSPVRQTSMQSVDGAPLKRRSSIIENIHDGADNFPRIDFPITFEAAETIRLHLTKNGGKDRMNDRIATQLLVEFTEKYKVRHPCAVSELTLPTSGKTPRLIIVGDTHGQLQDVLYIFNTYGPPTASNVYLFNGDVSDRGPYSCEIFFMIFAYYLADESSILMNRGNHESEEMHALEAYCGGGFRDEVFGKYDSATYWRFVSAMRNLQLVTLINKKVFVVHGGLSAVEPLTIDFIKTIEHTTATMPEPASVIKQEQVWNDLLWSDPMDKNGMEESSRGVGVLFGPDVTQKFLRSNPGIKFMIRSHQVPDDQRGFQKQNGGKCITIFSASNYCGDSGNQGGILMFESSTFPEYTVNEYYAPTLEMMQQMVVKGDKDWGSAGKALREQQKKKIEVNWRVKEMQAMMVSLVEAKPDVWKYILEKTNGATTVDYDVWQEVMKSACGAAWRWDVAWETWKVADANGKVDMRAFLDRFTVVLSKEEYMSFKFKAITAVYESILHEHSSLESTLRLFDKDGDGTVDMQELREALGNMDVSLTDPQKDSLLHTLFKGAPETDGVPKLSVADFLSRFTVVYRSAGAAICSTKSGAQPRSNPVAAEAMTKIAQLIASTPLEKITSSAPGAKPTSGRKSGRKGTSPQSKMAKAKAAGKDKKDAKVKVTLAMKLDALFSALDVDKSGELDEEEFVTGLLALPGLSTIKLSNGQKLDKKLLSEVAKIADVSGDGQISILELLEAFTFEDSGGEDMGNSLAEHMLTVLFRHRQALRAGARCVDKEGSGRVSRDEFFKVLMALNKALTGDNDSKSVILETQICDLCDALTRPGESGEMEIVYEDLFNSFVVVDRENPSVGIRLGRKSSDTAT